MKGQNIHSDFWDLLVFFVILNSTQFIPIKISGAQVTLVFQKVTLVFSKKKFGTRARKMKVIFQTLFP